MIHAYIGYRLVTAVQVRKTNDCCYRKQSLHQDFREGQLYPLKLPVESDHCQVTALPCADLVLSTRCCRSSCYQAKNCGRRMAKKNGFKGSAAIG